MREEIKLIHPISLPAGVLTETAMRLKVVERYKGLIEDLYPRAYQLLCKEKRFLDPSGGDELEGMSWGELRDRAGVIEKRFEVLKAIEEPSRGDLGVKSSKQERYRARNKEKLAEKARARRAGKPLGEREERAK